MFVLSTVVFAIDRFAADQPKRPLFRHRSRRGRGRPADIVRTPGNRGAWIPFSVAFTISGSPGRTMGVAALAGCSQAGGGAVAGMALAMAPGNAAPAAAALLACAVVVLATKAADWR